MTINRFIEEQTRGRIKDLVPQGFINPNAMLVVTNAVYFKGSWLYAFDKSRTRESDFRVSGGKTVRVPMMCMEPQGRELMYADLGDAQVLELPYAGGRLSMVVILPKGGLEDFERGLSLERVESYIAALKPEKLGLVCIPRFELQGKYVLNDHLESMAS